MVSSGMLSSESGVIQVLRNAAEVKIEKPSMVPTSESIILPLKTWCADRREIPQTEMVTRMMKDSSMVLMLLVKLLDVLLPIR